MKSSVLRNSNKVLKIANILLDGRFGGPQNRVLQVSEKLINYGIETLVIIPNKDSEVFYSKLISKNIKVKSLKLHRLTKHKPHLLGWLLFFIPEVIGLYKYLKNEKVCLVHCNAPWQIKGILAGKMAGAKVIWHLNNTELPKILKLIFNVIAHLSDGFILTGKRVKKFYFNNTIAKKKFIEIQAPVNTTHFDPNNIVADRAIRNNKGIKIVTVAVINPTKRTEDFINLAAILNKKYKDLCFYIVGQHLDSQKEYSKKLIKLINDLHFENISFYGKSDNVAEVLNAADIFVCTSEAESGPMSVWEAMAMEKAIVSTDVGDVSVYIKDGENGFIVQSKDVKALTKKVGILIEDKNMRVKFGKNARAVAVKELDIEICAEKHINFYFEVLGKRRRIEC